MCFPYLNRRRRESITLESVEFSAIGVTGKWVSDRNQQQAAWEMYVELVTRIATVPLGADEGLLREALSSLHALFGETRRVLRQYGPSVARPMARGELSFGAIAVDVLNKVVRPFLAKWHPLLLSHELARAPEVSQRDHERRWSHHDELRKELGILASVLREYADLLAKAAGIEPIH